jgi:hypothetical protein
MLQYDNYILFVAGLMLISLLITWRISRKFEPGEKKGWLNFSQVLGVSGFLLQNVLTNPWRGDALFPPSGNVFWYDKVGLFTLLALAFLALLPLVASYTQHRKKPDDLERMKVFLKEAKTNLIVIAILCLLSVVLELLPFSPPVL